MTGVTSDAAIASISAPPSLLKKDPLLTLILSIAPSHQIKIDQPKKSNNLSLTNTSSSSSSSSDSTNELTQRNAILRSICGMTFHNALDKHPFYLLGGHSASATASSESAICLASISSYMSIASSIRDSKEDVSSIYQGLNQVLMNNSFLVGSTPKPTLGDLDVFFAISTTSSENTITEEQVKGLVHFKRWLVATNAAVQEMLDDASSLTSSNLPQVTLPTLDFKLNDSLPMFYFGDEDGIDDIQTQNSSLPATVGGDAKKGGAAAAAAAKGGAAAAAAGGITEEQKKAAAEKRAKKNAAKASKKKQKSAASSAATPAAAATELNASALDIRVGKIIEVWEHEKSDKLWCEKVDLGGEGDGEVRQILSGLRKFYTKDEMQDQLVLVLCNLKKRNLVGVPSHGMVLCATNADHTEVEFVSPPPGAKIGERVTFDGYDGPAEPENKFAKKKMLEKLAPDLKTDGDGIVVWKGVKSVTSAGPCIASKGMKGAQVS